MKKRCNVFFDLDPEVEIGVIVETEFDLNNERELIIKEARKKLVDRGLDQFNTLPCSDIHFIENV